MTPDYPVLSYFWSILASLAGAITSLAFRSWHGLTRIEVALAIFAGTTFAFFVSPLIFHAGDNRASGGFFYLLATGWNVLLPSVIRRIGVALGSER